VIKSIKIIWMRHTERMGENRNIYGVLVEKPEGKRPLANPRHRWENNSKVDLAQNRFGG
jgi:hypothetical protein